MNQHAKRRQAARERHAPTPPKPRATAAAPRAAVEAGVLDFTVEADHAGLRLDRFLAVVVEAAGVPLSRTRLQTLVEEGAIAVDGATAGDPKAKVREGARVTLTVPAAAEAVPQAEAMPLVVVFEDAHLIVIDKPAGLVVHPAPGHATGTLVNGLLAHCRGSLSGVGGVARPGIVHRLDRDTSGLIVAAKDDRTHQGLAGLFADHGRTGSLVREYLALAWGPFDRSAGVVDMAIGRHPQMRDRMAVSRRPAARHALTHWAIEEDFGPAALVRCRLETGRTHQIRVHLAHGGHPLLGDAVYGGGFRTKATQLGTRARDALDGLDRQALHATTLGFEHPVTGEVLSFESAPPADLAALIDALREG